MSSVSSRQKAVGRVARGLLVVAAFLLIAHATPAQTPPEPAAQDFSAYGLVSSDIYQVRAPNGRLLVVRGKLRNPYDEQITGVRLIVRLLSPGAQPRTLDRLEKDLNVSIEPGQKIMFSRDVTTSYAYVFDRMTVAAFAQRRGTTELPAPSVEVEQQVSANQAVPFFIGNVPIVSITGGLGPILPSIH